MLVIDNLADYFVKFFSFRKYKYKRIFKSELISKYRLSEPIKKFINEDGLVQSIPNIDINIITEFQINELYKTIECFVDGNDIPFILFDYSDVLVKYMCKCKNITHNDIITEFLDLVTKHHGYLVALDYPNQIILDNLVYITETKYLDPDRNGCKFVYYSKSGLDSNTYNVKVKFGVERYETIGYNIVDLHQYLIQLNNLNKNPENFIKMEN